MTHLKYVHVAQIHVINIVHTIDTVESEGEKTVTSIFSL